MPADRRNRNSYLKAVRLALNMSQVEFATAIRHAGDALGTPNSCSKRLVQKWESGEHAICRPSYRRALESVTHKPYAELGFSDSMPGTLPRVRMLGSHSPAEIPSTTAPQRGDASEQLRYALNLPEVATAEAVNLVVEGNAYLFALESHTPARIMLPKVSQHVRDIAVMLSGTRQKSLRRRLIVAGGQSAALAGWLAFDLGDVTTAHRYWDSALTAAHHAADGPLLACILTHLSYSAAERGDPSAAFQLAHTAISHASNYPRAQAWMAVCAAQQAAQLGDARAALAELKLALNLVNELAPAALQDDAEPWYRFVDRAYIWAMAANVYGRLGGTESAHASAVRALESLSSAQTKTRALVLAEAAHAFTRAGDTNRATRLATEATALADKLESTLTQKRVRGLMHSCFEPHK